MVFSPPSAREFQKPAEKVKIVILRPRFRSGPKNLSVKSFSRSMVDAFHQQVHPQRFVPREPDHSDRDNVLGEYRTLLYSLPRLHRGLLTSSAARLRGVALKGSQPFTCDRNARRSATAHLFGGEQSARFAELCTVARKALSQVSRETRVLRERSTEGKNESQSDIRWCRRNQFFLRSCERGGAILQSDPLDQEGPNRGRAARR